MVAASGRLEGDEAYTLTFRTHHTNLSALRLEALASPSAPGGGPGTGAAGGFRPSTVRVTAAPLVGAAGRSPVTPKLQPVAVTAQEAGFELAKAVDADVATGWAVGGEPGKDCASVFAFDTPVGFDGGTLLTVELKFEGSGPLAARVIVNRLWHHHFGRGIVATPNDLSTQADPATHPELLEWLATRLVEDRWSMKSIHRLIVTSATYRQSGAVSDAGRSKDPDNKLLWHRSPTRLEVRRSAMRCSPPRARSTSRCMAAPDST